MVFAALRRNHVSVPLRSLSLFLRPRWLFYITFPPINQSQTRPLSHEHRHENWIWKKQRQSWIHVLYSYRVMTRDSTYLCVKIKHLAKDYVKNGKSGRRVVVAKADHSMDAVYLSLSLSLFILSPRRSLKSIVERLFHIHSVHLGQRTRVTICRLSKRDRLRRRGYYAALSPSPACRSIRSIGSPILHQPDTTTTCVIYIYIYIYIYICVCIFVFLT